MVKLQFDRNQQYKITLPKAIVEAKGWEKGKELSFSLNDDGNLVIRTSKSNKQGIEVKK